MKTPPWRKFVKGASLQRDFDEIKSLAFTYIKEETFGPLKDLGRFVLWGSIGSLFVGFGTTLLLIGALRFLQEQFKVLDGSLSWIPYLVVMVLGLFVVAASLLRVVKGTAKRRLKK